MKKITVATCSLNQFALDFQGNKDRIIESFSRANQENACYRLGPELEITGYGCNDHFFESDTILHSFEVLADILTHKECQDIIGDVGMPVMFKGVRYNCRVYFYNKRILLIRPKKYLANDGNYRESRWFSPWMHDFQVNEFRLPNIISKICGQETAPFGDGVLETEFATFGTELCEELFTPQAPHINLSLLGVEIFTNSSASHHEFRKLSRRVDLIREATLKCGGIYLYANQQGCDGERVYYDGSCMVIVNGDIVAQGSQFSLQDVEVVTATVDLDQVTYFRAGLASRNFQAATAIPRLLTFFCQHVPRNNGGIVSTPKALIVLSPSEEINMGPACWLWDYLRRSKQSGFFLPLSGGIDSCSTALIVYSMCQLVFAHIYSERQVLLDLQSMVNDRTFHPKSAKEICGALFTTAYIRTRNSSAATRNRAKKLAEAICSHHYDIDIDVCVDSFLNVFTLFAGKTPQFRSDGGSNQENLALQNVQARCRMVVSYLFAQLTLWTRDRKGSLLVLGSSNVDEALRGYLTKYDCSSADLNPIGGISKVDLQDFVKFRSCEDDLSFLQEFLDAPPAAELEPVTESYSQTDEVDMGMTYKELSMFGTLRKVYKLGPVSMSQKLWDSSDKLTCWSAIVKKVEHFFTYYGINRHKSTVLPPSYHMSAYSPDDNRFDLRQFLYPSWEWQFRRMSP